MYKVVETEEYSMCYSVDNVVDVSLFRINEAFRGKKLSYRIFQDLIDSYLMPIELRCWETLIPYYEKLGFECLYQDYDEYHVMIRHVETGVKKL